MFTTLSRIPLIAICCFLSIALRAEEPAPKAPPAKLQVPVGHAVLFKLTAMGSQIYKSVPAANGNFKWELEAPLANLYDNDGKQVGRHYEGPIWESIDGSKVKKIDDDAVIKDDAPNPNQDIPWLLLHVKDENGDKPGAFSKVQYIQRIDTKGGVMPTDPPTKPGIRVFISYTATYVLYN